MFIGHFAVGFAGKKAAPGTSLAVLIGAALWPDVVWPVFVLVGWEHVRIEPGNTAVTPLAFDSYPISHSLVADLGWATLLAVVYYAAARYRPGCVVIWIAVMSHWVLDFISHRPDLPIVPGMQTVVGLGLWNSRVGTVVVEGGFFALAVWVYATATQARDGAGVWGLWSFVALLLLLYAANLFGPPPPGVTVLAWSGIACLPLFLWVWWFDRHRAVTAV
ncbi:MAG TPA: hypothetical protein VLZ12_02965 [Verrucomicrobiae bacterium]|nr:hypothetical protein [Verrucomicrobiae bacterium]